MALGTVVAILIMPTLNSEHGVRYVGIKGGQENE